MFYLPRKLAEQVKNWIEFGMSMEAAARVLEDRNGREVGDGSLEDGRETRGMMGFAAQESGEQQTR